MSPIVTTYPGMNGGDPGGRIVTPAYPDIPESTRPGDPRSFPGTDRELFEQQRSYSVVRHVVDTLGASLQRSLETRYNVAGDHFAVLDVIGPHFMGVRFGANRGWLPLQRGLIVNRPFDTFTIRCFDRRIGNINAVMPATEALVLASYGEMVKRILPREKGFVAGFLSLTQTATATGADLLDPTNFYALNGGIGAGNGVPSWLFRGGKVRLHNRDAATIVYIYWGTPGSFGGGGAMQPSTLTAWQLLPGQKEEFDFESGPRFILKQTQFGPGGQTGTLCVATAAGTASVGAIFTSPASDLSDADDDYNFSHESYSG